MIIVFVVILFIVLLFLQNFDCWVQILIKYNDGVHDGSHGIQYYDCCL